MASVSLLKLTENVPNPLDPALSLGLNRRFFQEEFDNDVDALLEEGMPVPKKMRMAEDKYGGDSDHQSDAEEGVQPMMTKIKTVLKSEWWICLLSFGKVYSSKSCCNVVMCACVSIFSSAGRGRPPTEPLPDGWIMTFHNSGIPVYLHRETRVVTWSRPYFLGTGSIRVLLFFAYIAAPSCFRFWSAKMCLFTNVSPASLDAIVFCFTYSVAVYFTENRRINSLVSFWSLGCPWLL